jgi:hypothetical protein
LLHFESSRPNRGTQGFDGKAKNELNNVTLKERHTKHLPDPIQIRYPEWFLILITKNSPD